MSRGGLRAEFIAGSLGRIMVVAHVPRTRPRNAVLVVPAFAEEMNKCRRMVAELARRLHERGTALVSVDLYGTGDSEGLLEDASWAGWQGDVGCAARWAAEQGLLVDAMLGIRLGCALTLDSLAGLPFTPSRLVFWQPALDGRRLLDQFLRLAVTAAMAKGVAGVSVSGFRSQLAAGHQVYVAGYSLTPSLAASIDSTGSSVVMDRRGVLIDWLELVRGDSTSLPAGSAAAIKAISSSGADVLPGVVAGLPFWTSTEVAVVPSLLDLTVDRLGGA